jgi:hypothetical protein
LIQGQTTTSEARRAQLGSLLDRQTYDVQVGDVISVRDTEYKVVDIGETRVVLVDQQTAKTTVVGPISDEERAVLQRGGQEGQQLPMDAPSAVPAVKRP